MKKNILHYSLLASTSVLAVVVILLGFSQYNNALGMQGVNEAAAVAASVAAVPASTNHPNSAGLVAKRGNNLPFLPDMETQRGVAIINSWLSPNLTAAQANGTEWAQYRDYTTPDPALFSGNSMNVCHQYLSPDTAHSLIAFMNSRGFDISDIASTSRRFVYMWQMEQGYAEYFLAAQIGDVGRVAGGFTGPLFAYCLDSGFVSNYDNYLTSITSFARSNPYNIAVPIYTFPSTGSGIGNRPGTNSPYNPTHSPINITQPGATVVSATSSKAYTVSVNYDKFTAEARTSGYTSVYTTTGTKSVSITVFKFANGSSLTASAVIAKLAALGYRPATLSEIYSLKQSQSSSVNSSTVALGTNLGGSYGYPTGQGTGSSGLGRNAGPFATATWSFVAVKN